MLNARLDHNIENLLSVYEQLRSIEEIKFTNREIDIISCISQGRVTKKIAIILAISYKTVGTHISKIMLKIGCCSQEKIIDFIEQSDKYNILRQHYINLLINSSFRQELININSMIGKVDTTYLVIGHECQSKYKHIFNELCRYLKLAGMAVSFVKADNYVKSNNFIGNVLHCCFADYSALSIIVPRQEINFQQDVIFFGQQDVKSANSNLDNPNNINLHDYNNLYFFIFSVLKQLLPNINIESNIANFKKLYARYIDSECIPPTVKSKSSVNGSYVNVFLQLAYGFFINIKQLANLRNKALWLLVCFLIIAILAIKFIFSNYINGVDTYSTNNAATNADSRSIVWNLPRQDHKFIGRQKLLNELQKKLHPKYDRAGSAKLFSVVSVCAGLGGVGKTQLALQYIHNTKRAYALKAWFQAENIDQLKQQYVDFALWLGYIDGEPSFAKAQLYIKEWLAQHTGWLLVYDNVNSYNDIKEFLPSDGGSVILTSRQQKWPNTFTKVDVDVMSEDEAMQLIKSLLQRKITVVNQDGLEELVKELGCLPLALAQAGAYIEQNIMSIADYLKLYKKHEQALLLDDTLPEGTNSLPITTTWNVSLEAIAQEMKIKDQSSLSINLLTACAYFAPEKISWSLLLTWFKESYPEISNHELMLQKMIGKLWQYSLISKDNKENITIHRLVQTVLRYQHKQSLEKNPYYIPITQQWFNSLLGSVHAEFIKKTTVVEDETRQKNLLPHMQSLLQHYQQIWPNATTLNLAVILHDLGEAFQLIGEYRVAKAYYESVLSIVKQDYSKNYAQVCLTLDQLGNIYRILGDIKQAKLLHERSLQIREKYYGKDHSAIANTLDHLGRDCRILGDAKRAQILHGRSLQIKEKYYAKDDIEIAKTLDYLGRDHINLFNIEQAKALHERCLQIKEKYYGSNHFEVAMTLDYLGKSSRMLGEVHQAIKLHERSLKAKEAYYGKDHIEVALTLVQLGLDYSELGEFLRAQKNLERALKINEQFYGKHHIAVAYAMEHLGSNYRKLGNAEQAKILHVEALRLKEQLYDKDNIEVSLTLEQLARDQVMLGNTKQAKNLYQRALRIKQQYYGHSHSLTVETKQAIIAIDEKTS